MNNAKLWLVVKPTVGIPLFLSAVAIGSFAVHLAVLSHTTWYDDYMKGQKLGGGDEKSAALKLDTKDMDNVNRAAFEKIENGQRVTIILPDGRRAVAVVEDPTVMAKAPDDRRSASD